MPVGFLAVAVLVFASSVPASAQGFFESLFGGLRRTVTRPAESLPTNIHAFSDPFTSLIDALSSNPRVPRNEVGPAAAYCVRSCDGHFFPVRANANLSAADACRAFCPAAATRIYSGGGIDNAVASDGTRYADSENAFVYRQQMVDNCTCNGRDAFGLANIDVTTDPTLRPGDVVATKSGFVAFTGAKNKTAEFTPIQSYPGLAKATRDKLADTHIMPGIPGGPNAEPVKLPLAANNTGSKDDERRRVQLSQ